MENLNSSPSDAFVNDCQIVIEVLEEIIREVQLTSDGNTALQWCLSLLRYNLHVLVTQDQGYANLFQEWHKLDAKKGH